MITDVHDEAEQTLLDQLICDGYLGSAGCPTCCFGAREEWDLTDTDMMCPRGHAVSIGLLREWWGSVIQQAAQVLDVAAYMETHFSHPVNDLDKERGLLEEVVRFYQ